MIFQQPTRSLNPAYTVGEQIAEVLRTHQGASRADAWRTAVGLLERVGIARAAERAKEYPHTFSGGMCQRVMIAIALARRPKLIIADEPTTALDVTVQAKVLDLLREMQTELGAAIIFITHDLGVIAQMSERTAVMYAGKIVETAPTIEIFQKPVHPYTRGLVASVPRMGSSKRLVAIPGTVPPAHAIPSGCRFQPRCPLAIQGRCDVAEPVLIPLTDRHDARCVRAGELWMESAQ
jgi:oligopeptide/dipeptide ABC transporter ATP-binding protein